MVTAFDGEADLVLIARSLWRGGVQQAATRAPVATKAPTIMKTQIPGR